MPPLLVGILFGTCTDVQSLVIIIIQYEGSVFDLREYSIWWVGLEVQWEENDDDDIVFL